MAKLIRYKEIFFILFLLFLSAFLRLYKIADYMTFLGDEGRDVLVVYNILQGHLTLLGPTSSVGGFFLGPIYYYFMTPFLWLFNYDPSGPAVMVALFGVATVYLIYKIGSEFFNQETGFTAAILYSISPLVIAYSRSSWNPNLMPFFSLITLYFLYKAVVKNNIKLFLLSGFLYGIIMQLHYVGLFIAPIIAAFLFLNEFLIYRVSLFTSLLITIKRGILLFFGFIIGLSPFFIFEIRHGFLNMRSIVNFILNSGETGGNEQFLSTITNVFFRLFGRLIANLPPPEQVSFSAHFNIAVWYYVTLLLGILSVGIFAFHFYQTFKKNRETSGKLLLLLLWFFIGIFLFGFYKKNIYDYYFGFMFPLPFLFVGNLISYLSLPFKFMLNRGRHESTRINIIGKILSLAIFIILIWTNLSGVPFRYPANQQLNQAQTISRFIFDKVGNKPFNFALITGGNSDHAYRYFFTLWGKPPVAVQNPSQDPKRKTATDQLWVICETLPCAPLGHSLWEIAGFGRAEIAGEWNVSVVKVYKLIHYKGKD